jgi:hippurate hydrolase
MTVWAGVVRALAAKKTAWRGTVIMVAQPAEEIIQGARAMLADGLYARFGRPDYALALHDGTGPAGTVQVNLAANASAADTVDIEVKGVGGHGAYPADTKDPVVLASRIVLALQTLVSRENDPFRPAVVTVGSIHGGTKHNIIGENVHLQLTVRSFDAGVQTRLIEGIRRIARGEAIAAGLPETLYPEVTVDPNGTQPTINTTALATRIKALFQKTLRPDKVLEGNPSMASEDYNQFGLADPRIQTVMYSLGAVNADVWAKAQQDGTKLPGPHNPRWAPDPAPTIATGVATMTDAVMMLLPAAR